MSFNIIVVALGGAIGSIIRYQLSIYLSANLDQKLPYATFIINTLGGFLIGLLSTLIMIRYVHHSEILRNLLVIGFLGGLTTFSTFSYEAFELLKLGHIKYALLYIVTSVVISICATWFGIIVAKFFQSL